MSKIRIKRNTGWVGTWSAIEIYIDDKKVGAINNHETQDFIVKDGKQEVYAKSGWDCSQKVKLNTSENEIRVLKLTQFKYLAWALPIIFSLMLFYGLGKDALNLNGYYFSIIIFTLGSYPLFYNIIGKNNIFRLTEIDKK
ncbi:hypothetical protein [Carboxylicivirga sp. M1479]|uniref:hypothetical protein n=1 Tax=Carboxylicivirga sp. M1479 TaxID=2594476 RepID=UPI001177B366|nr:hypothetical protein [Carboxylicivirga sp. M1479]TRX71543.1 hypothetical protein FNN09_06110 [Carboxylicivirga sp. M1479]